MLARDDARPRYSKIAFLSSASPEAEAHRDRLIASYGNAASEEADVAVVLGGDGTMLQALHHFMGAGVPIFGMNRGTVGFLMNEARDDDLLRRLEEAQPSILHPLTMLATTTDGTVHRGSAFNEVFLSRQTHQAVKLRISIDGTVRMSELVADGAMVATPAGSTAYNLSVGGTILPLSTSLMTLTPISAFRPRRWGGALLRDSAVVRMEVMEAARRPVSAVADNFEVRDVAHVEIAMDLATGAILLHDPGTSLDERILLEQFGD